MGSELKEGAPVPISTDVEEALQGVLEFLSRVVVERHACSQMRDLLFEIETEIIKRLPSAQIAANEMRKRRVKY